MRYSKLFVIAALLFTSAISFSFLPGHVASKRPLIDHYSIDPLPDSWKQDKSLVNAIDLILTSTVKELEASTSCTDCANSPYSVSLLIDSPVIMKQTYEDIGDKKNSGGFNYACKTVFRFKSSLAVYDGNQKGVAKVMITNPEEDEYTITRKFNIFSKAGTSKLTPEEYISKNASTVGPGMIDMISYAEKKVYRIRDDIKKLKGRHR